MISDIGFGCMSLKPNNPEAIQILRKAAENNITIFDTADLYDKGLNEELIGKALSTIRNNVVISTKVGNEWNNDGTSWRWNPSKSYILNSVNESLRRLKTDYIDIYQLHGGTLDDPIDECIEAFEILKKQGKIRNYGISSIRPNVIKEWVSRSNMSFIMMQYSLLDRRPEEQCLNILDDANIKVLTRGTVAKGMLLNKKADNYLGYSKNDVHKMKTAVAKTKNSLATAIQFVHQQNAVKSSVIGIRTFEHLNDVLEARKAQISHEVLNNVSKLLTPNVYEKHRI